MRHGSTFEHGERRIGFVCRRRRPTAAAQDVLVRTCWSESLGRCGFVLVYYLLWTWTGTVAAGDKKREYLRWEKVARAAGRRRDCRSGVSMKAMGGPGGAEKVLYVSSGWTAEVGRCVGSRKRKGKGSFLIQQYFYYYYGDEEIRFYKKEWCSGKQGAVAAA